MMHERDSEQTSYGVTIRGSVHIAGLRFEWHVVSMEYAEGGSTIAANRDTLRFAPMDKIGKVEG